MEQVKDFEKKVNFTFFILYDLNYLNTQEKEFYNIDPKILKNIKIKYLNPEYIVEKKIEIMKKHKLTEREVDLVIGKGYAKARNCIVYEALEEKIDYLLFWDDDEYPLAALKDGKDIKWVKQNNVLQHLKYIDKADITYGYRCGMINPLPYVEYNETITEDIFKQFIEALENEVISWDKLQYMLKNESEIGYADETIATYNKQVDEIKKIGKENFVLGSGICLNLTHIDKIPAFYNPPEARGEDTFFSCALRDKGTKVLRIPVYHFHDAFLKFTFLMEEKFPKKIKKVTTDDNGISLRLKRTITGWIKYKPLLYYIFDKENYRNIIDETKIKLENSIRPMSTAFEDCDLTNLPVVLEEYDNKVIQHYQEYIETNKIWDKIKKNIMEDNLNGKVNKHYCTSI